MFSPNATMIEMIFGKVLDGTFQQVETELSIIELRCVMHIARYVCPNIFTPNH